jgi:hypothetical protein
MQFGVSLLIACAGLLAAGSVHSVRADETSSKTLKFKDDTTFELELRPENEGKVCGESWYFATKSKSTDFKLEWIGDGVERRFLVIKTEVWRTDASRGCHFDSEVNRMDVSVLDPAADSPADPLHTVSIAPEEHDQFSDLAIAERVGSFLRLYAGEQEDDPKTRDPGGPYRYYDLLSGKLLFLADEWTSVAEFIPKGAEDPSRFIGVTVRRGPIFDGSEESKSGYIATVTYASRDGALQQVKILRSSGATIMYDDLDPRIVLIGGNIYGGDQIIGKAAKSGEIIFRTGSSDAETFDGSEVRIMLTNSVNVDIPLTRDRLDFGAAVLPPGLTLSPIE